ncbi:MAG: hypothetical protein H0U81_04915 [Pyrinomonadaceae bacterium]|nr:hypothetical protein [Pyrinomonadaceae bacterium]
MKPSTLRMLGLLCVLAAGLLFVLNLRRFTNLGTYFIASPLLILGVTLVALARRRSKRE